MSLRDPVLTVAAFTVLWIAACLPVLLSPLGSYPVVDASWHYAWASEAALGNPAIYSPYFRAPLYPLILGLVYSVTGSSVTVGVLLSYLFAALSLVIVHRIVYFRAGRKAAFIAAALMGVNGVFVFYSSTLLITPLYMLLLLCSFYLFEKEIPSRYGWLLLGFAACARPSALLLFPLALILYRKQRKFFWLFFIPVSAVWAVNWSSGDPATVISSQGGINFYIGSGPEADGYTSFAPLTLGNRPPPDSLPYVDNVWAASLRPFEPGSAPSEVSAVWVGRTFRYITENPGTSAFLLGRKLVYLLSPVAIPSNYDVYYFSKYSPVLGIITGTPKFPVSGLLLWLAVPGVLISGALNMHQRNTLLWIAVLSIGILPFFVTARFLLPVLPFVVILLGQRFLRRPAKALALAPLGLAAGLVLAMLTSNTVSTGGVNMAFHDGLAHYEKGFIERSEMLLLQSLDVALERNDGVDLNGTDALFNLGVIAIRRGDPVEAEMYWRLALERNPGFNPAIQALQGLTR